MMGGWGRPDIAEPMPLSPRQVLHVATDVVAPVLDFMLAHGHVSDLNSIVAREARRIYAREEIAVLGP
jgi:hypothetical protein